MSSESEVLALADPSLSGIFSACVRPGAESAMAVSSGSAGLAGLDPFLKDLLSRSSSSTLSIPSLFLQRYNYTIGLPSLHYPNQHKLAMRDQAMLTAKVQRW